MTINNGKPGDLRPDLEGAARTPPHEHGESSMVGYTVNAVALRNHSSVGLIGERSVRAIFSTNDWEVLLQKPILFTLGFILIPQQMCEKQEKHMCLHPDNIV